ncbi:MULTISPECIES: LysR family transcriptional regulator [Pseudomonadaceae]|uniref:Transcriptional regulator, LysR family n=2 Tax=Ectopseudomonas TaxID=3236654 RepID=A4XTW3_ECTM1|nr:MULTISPECIES: LysR family transcriptional regulator [Pseudomonas]MBF8162506.1 LysR family transcriptional regulator [Pseudomonas mendocina]MDH0098493.1 LysR family transcriptional regulator [Pseudomonas sp. GD04158]USR37766.1 LysR family transcriptional regulator [Pseudomonas hydrolytica]UTH29570.1 LysR family transcriptional regulator [Pseudomonas hydrolytica]UZZ08600.1 LysR family transcriptional regulator [Pseudomonas mendocina]
MRRLNFHHLHYFWAVAKEGNLTRAAQSLHVAQSALSTQIRALEEQLGHPLFIRSGRNLLLTEAGRLVLDYAESIFALGSELQMTLQGALQANRQLRIGAVATLSRNFQENLLRPFLGRAELRITLESGSLGELLERLALHKLDVVLTNQAVSSDAQRPWRCRLLDRQTVCLVGPPRTTGQSFELRRDLPQARLIVPGRSSDIRSQFELFCDSHDLQPNICAEVDDMAMLRLLARDSGDLALLPAVVVQDELQAGLLQLYAEIPEVAEQFFAVTLQRHFNLNILDELLAQRPG